MSTVFKLSKLQNPYFIEDGLDTIEEARSKGFLVVLVRTNQLKLYN